MSSSKCLRRLIVFVWLINFSFSVQLIVWVSGKVLTGRGEPEGPSLSHGLCNSSRTVRLSTGLVLQELGVTNAEFICTFTKIREPSFQHQFTPQSVQLCLWDGHIGHFLSAESQTTLKVTDSVVHAEGSADFFDELYVWLEDMFIRAKSTDVWTLQDDCALSGHVVLVTHFVEFRHRRMRTCTMMPPTLTPLIIWCFSTELFVSGVSSFVTE